MGYGMPGLGAPVGQNEPPYFDAARGRISRQRKLVDELRQQKAPQSQMVSGIYVAPDITQQLAGGLGAAANEYQDYSLDQQEAQLGQQEQKAFGDWVSAIPRARQVTQNFQAPPEVPNDDDGNPMPMVDRSMEFTQQPTREDKLAWLGQGMAIPMARQAASKGFSELIDQQPKALGESMYVDADGNVQQNPAWADNKRMQLEQRAMEIRGRLDDRRLDRESREALQRAEMETRRELARIRAEQAIAAEMMRGDYGLAREGMKGNRNPASEKTRRGLVETQADLDQLSEAITELSSAPGKGTGLIPGLIQNAVPFGMGSSIVNQYMRDPATANAIQKLMYITDGIRHGRFGSALTAVEKASALSYLPGEADDVPELMRKAQGILEIVQKRHELLKAEMSSGGSGGTPAPVFRPGTGGASGSAAPATAPQRGVQTPAPAGVTDGGPGFDYTVTDTDSYNAVPAGGMYKAPDGTIRRKGAQ
jgi:hypothetical protein